MERSDAGTRPPRLKAKPMAGRRGETARRRIEIRGLRSEVRSQRTDESRQIAADSRQQFQLGTRHPFDRLRAGKH